LLSSRNITPSHQSQPWSYIIDMFLDMSGNIVPAKKWLQRIIGLCKVKELTLYMPGLQSLLIYVPKCGIRFLADPPLPAPLHWIGSTVYWQIERCDEGQSHLIRAMFGQTGQQSRQGQRFR
jgi:hypothetical protein